MKNKEGTTVENLLSENLSCYVLITCEEPTETGEMPVKMTYQGDEALVSYLLQGAQSHMDQVEENREYCFQQPSLSLVEKS